MTVPAARGQPLHGPWSLHHSSSHHKGSNDPEWPSALTYL